MFLLHGFVFGPRFYSSSSHYEGRLLDVTCLHAPPVGIAVRMQDLKPYACLPFSWNSSKVLKMRQVQSDFFLAHPSCRLMSEIMLKLFFWVISLCGLKGKHQRYRGTCSFHLQVWRWITPFRWNILSPFLERRSRYWDVYMPPCVCSERAIRPIKI